MHRRNNEYIFRLTFTHLATPVMLQSAKKVQWKCSSKLINVFICAQSPYGIEPGYMLPFRMEFGGVSTPWTHPLNFHLRKDQGLFSTEMDSLMITDHFGASPEELCMAVCFLALRTAQTLHAMHYFPANLSRCKFSWKLVNHPYLRWASL